MEDFIIKYRKVGKALAPQPIRLQVPGWGGSAELKMRNGSEPQPWHCPPFVDGAAYGLELIYHYEVPCQVVNENGDVRFRWNYSKEPGGIYGPDEFGVFAPRPNKFYFFATLIDLQPPPGYLLRTQPHPRFYTDETGTAPAAVVGHVQAQWWSKRLFVVFKAPRPGESHIFRKGEPYVQLTCVPADAGYRAVEMTPEEAKPREELERDIILSKTFLAKSVWFNGGGSEFNDHYRVLARAFAKDGEEGVRQATSEAVARLASVVPPGRSADEYLAMAARYQAEGKDLEARTALFEVRRLDPNNAEAAMRLGILADSAGLPKVALGMMSQAVQLHPRAPGYRYNLGEALRRQGQFQEAESAFRAGLELAPGDARLQSQLGIALAQQGRGEEALRECESAAAAAPNDPGMHLRLGQVLANQGRFAEARAAFERSLALDPKYAAATESLKELSRIEGQMPQTPRPTAE